MKRTLLAILVILFICQNAFAQFSNNNGEYEIYVNEECNEAVVVHFMGKEAVAFSHQSWHPTTTYLAVTNALKKDPQILDKWVNGNDVGYYWVPVNYDSSESTYSTTLYKGKPYYSQTFNSTWIYCLYFNNDHKICKYVVKGASGTTKTLTRVELDDLMPIEYRLKKKNSNDNVVYE